MFSIRPRVLTFVLVVALLSIASLVSACSRSAEPQSAEPQKTEQVSTEPVKLVVWWWGEQEAPGAQKWMDETIALYQKENPNITIEAVLQSTDGMIPAFQAAIAAKSGPDIQYVWGGVWTLEFVWSGGLRPLDDLIPAEEWEHYVNNYERAYDGKTWGIPWYLSGNPLVYNKQLFSKAGLDPNTPPTTWDELLEACKKFNAIGVVPFSGWMKDGWYGGWLFSILGRQPNDSEKDYMDVTVGAAKFTDPEYAEYWTRQQELIDAGCWNEDIMSLDQYQGLDMFVQEKSAMVFGNDTFLGTWVTQMGEDKIGVMMVPKYSDGKLADTYVVTAQGLGVTSWSEHPQEAADFLMFMHTPERLNAWFKDTGVLPADDRMDASLITQGPIKQLYKWATTVAGPNLENFIPSQIDVDCNYTGFQLLLNGEKTPAEIAAMCEEAVTNWREQNPEVLKNWETWMSTYGK